jgi:hypothetical protein
MRRSDAPWPGTPRWSSAVLGAVRNPGGAQGSRATLPAIPLGLSGTPARPSASPRPRRRGWRAGAVRCANGGSRAGTPSGARGLGPGPSSHGACHRGRRAGRFTGSCRATGWLAKHPIRPAAPPTRPGPPSARSRGRRWPWGAPATSAAGRASTASLAALSPARRWPWLPCPASPRRGGGAGGRRAKPRAPPRPAGGPRALLSRRSPASAPFRPRAPPGPVRGRRGGGSPRAGPVAPRPQCALHPRLCPALLVPPDLSPRGPRGGGAAHLGAVPSPAAPRGAAWATSAWGSPPGPSTAGLVRSMHPAPPGPPLAGWPRRVPAAHHRGGPGPLFPRVVPGGCRPGAGVCHRDDRHGRGAAHLRSARSPAEARPRGRHPASRQRFTRSCDSEVMKHG